MTERRVVTPTRWRIAAAWVSGAVLGVLLGLALGGLLMDLRVGIVIGLAAGLVMALAMLRWARGVNSGPPASVDRRTSDTDYGPLGPGVYNAGHVGRDGGRT